MVLQPTPEREAGENQPDSQLLLQQNQLELHRADEQSTKADDVIQGSDRSPPV